MIEHEVSPGTDISRACRDAVELADRRGESVAFRFNDVDVTVIPGEAPAAAVIRWREETDRQVEAYRNSPEGKATAAEAERDRRRHQRETDALIARFSGVVKDLGALVRWCVELSRAADHVGVAWNPHDVADAIEAAGYVRDAHVGESPESIGADRRRTGEYIVGQVVACLRRGMPPHPVIEKFAREGGFLPPEVLLGDP